MEVLLDDHVVLKGEKTGRVRYLGHLDGVGQPQGVFAGVALDAPGKCATSATSTALVSRSASLPVSHLTLRVSALCRWVRAGGLAAREGGGGGQSPGKGVRGKGWFAEQRGQGCSHA